MPSTASKIQNESRAVRRLIAEFLRVSHAKQLNPMRQTTLLRKIRKSLDYLDQNAIVVGTNKVDVEALLGPAPGHAGTDRWFYPGGAHEETYRIDFQSDRVLNKEFVNILTN